MNHHECGDSSLERRAKCPASMMMERGLPDIPSKYAEEGEHLHKCVVDIYNGTDGHEELSIEERQAVDVCVCFLREYDVVGCDWYFERTLYLYDEDGSVINYGTPDAYKIIGEEGRAIIADWKFGYKEVSAPLMNWQLAGYAAKIMKVHEITRAECHLIQPRVSTKPQPYIFTNFEAIVSNIKRVIAACHELDAKLVAGSHCNYCKAKENRCHAYLEMASKIQALQLDEIDETNIEQLLAFVTEHRKQADRANELIKQAVRDCNGRLGKVSLEMQKGNRKAKARELYSVVKDCLTADEYMALCSTTLGEVEGLYAKRLVERGEVDTLAQAKKRLNDSGVFERGESKEVLKVRR